MADEVTYYVFRADNCRFEGMTKEQILTAITQAVETGTIQNVDTGFVTKIKEQNSGSAVTLWVGTQAQYNALGTKEPNCLYIVTDDDTISTIQNAILALQNGYDGIASTNAVVDVSSSTALTCQTNYVAVNNYIKKYIYSKALGIVFFTVSFDANFQRATGSFTIKHKGSFLPEATPNSPSPVSVYVYGAKAVANYHTGSMQNVKTGYLTVVCDSDLEGEHHFDVCGWYFAQEEAT